jgi:hypothetical protein
MFGRARWLAGNLSFRRLTSRGRRPGDATAPVAGSRAPGASRPESPHPPRAARRASALLAVVASSVTLTACHDLYCSFVEGLTGQPLDCSHEDFPDLGDIDFPPLPPPPSLPTTSSSTPPTSGPPGATTTIGAPTTSSVAPTTTIAPPPPTTTVTAPSTTTTTAGLGDASITGFLAPRPTFTLPAITVPAVPSPSRASP